MLAENAVALSWMHSCRHIMQQTCYDDMSADVDMPMSGTQPCESHEIDNSAIPHDAPSCVHGLGWWAQHMPVGLIENDDLVSSWRQSHLFLCKHFYFISHHIYAPVQQIPSHIKNTKQRPRHAAQDSMSSRTTPVIGCIQLQHCFLIVWS